MRNKSPTKGVTQQDIDTIYDSVLKARVALAKALPYISDVLFALRVMKETARGVEHGLLAVDRGWRIIINYKAMCAVKEAIASDDIFSVLCMFLIYHEVLHVLREHVERGKNRNSMLWNIAADLEVNPAAAEIFPKLLPVLKALLYFPENFELPPHMPAEWYYEQLMSKAVALPGVADDKYIADELLDEEDEQEQVTELLRHAIREKTAQEIQKAQRQVGKVPQGLLRWAQDYLQPRVNWREVLRRRLLRKVGYIVAAEGDFTYLRPNKKTAWYRTPTAVLPTKAAMPLRIAVIIDTSGSMDDFLLGQAVAEVREICRALGTHVYIISCDADVHKVAKIWGKRLSRETLHNILVGGGGTILTNGILYAQNKLKANLSIVLTDGYSFWERVEEVSIPVIVGVIRSEGDKEDLQIPSKFDTVIIKEVRSSGRRGEKARSLLRSSGGLT